MVQDHFTKTRSLLARDSKSYPATSPARIHILPVGTMLSQPTTAAKSVPTPTGQDMKQIVRHAILLAKYPAQRQHTPVIQVSTSEEAMTPPQIHALPREKRWSSMAMLPGKDDEEDQASTQIKQDCTIAETEWLCDICSYRYAPIRRCPGGSQARESTIRKPFLCYRPGCTETPDKSSPLQFDFGPEPRPSDEVIARMTMDQRLQVMSYRLLCFFSERQLILLTVKGLESVLNGYDNV